MAVIVLPLVLPRLVVARAETVSPVQNLQNQVVLVEAVMARDFQDQVHQGLVQPVHSGKAKTVATADLPLPQTVKGKVAVVVVLVQQVKMRLQAIQVMGAQVFRAT